jgi:hypothetical protein
MIYPTICLDNFFNEPLKVLEFSKNLEFYKDPEGRWPGERSKLLHEIDFCFFKNFGLKVMSILYPNVKNVQFKCRLSFQKISNKYVNSGWIHKDTDYEFTCIVYLSSHKNCGTSIFDSKKICSEILNNEKKEYTYTKNLFEEEEKYLKENNNQFEETISIKSKFNRCIMFDGANSHAAQKFYENDVQEERLTLIGFFNDIYFPGIKYNGIEHKRIF